MIELKFGRPCIVDYGSLVSTKAKYIQAYDDGHHVLIDSGIIFTHNVKPDLSAPPMNGDEVECSDDKINWDRVFFIGKTKNQRYITESFAGEPLEFKYVRHPQPSKREQLIDLINKRKSIHKMLFSTKSLPMKS